MRGIIFVLGLLAAGTAFAEESIKVQGKKGSVIIGPDGSVKVVDGTTTVDMDAHGAVRVEGADGTNVRMDATTPLTTAPGAVNLIDNDKVGSHDCAGGTADIAGNRNKLTFTNCSNVFVRGNYNKVTLSTGSGSVELLGNYNKAWADSLAKASILGNYNSLQWAQGASGNKPAVSNLGKHNTVTRK